jgi:hypothetical protein
MADPNNVGRCVDFTVWRNQGAQLVQINKQGYKITGITAPMLRVGDEGYEVRSEFGNGPETDIIRPGNVTQMYDCPAAAEPANVEMQGGSHRRGHKAKGKRKSKKTRKARKASKRTRKH